MTAITQDTLVKTQSLFRICVVGSFLHHKSVAAATRRILGWSPRSSLMLVVSHVTSLCVLRVPPLLVFPSEYHHCLSFFCCFSCQQNQDELPFFLVLSVCIIAFFVPRGAHDGREQEGPRRRFLVRVRGCMTGENKRDHNAASLFEFGGAMNDWCDQAQSALL